jgi:hypothetical protein
MTQNPTYRGIDGVEYRELIKPKTILITRIEGPSNRCGKVQTCTGWSDANVTLRLNSTTVSKSGGGYDKHDFTVIFEDGTEYNGRYDLYHWTLKRADLAGHVRTFVQWCANNPKAEQMLTTVQIAAAKRFLATYDLEQPVPVAA